MFVPYTHEYLERDEGKSRILGPSNGDVNFDRDLYYLAYIKIDETTIPRYVGRKQKWVDRKVLKFMLKNERGCIVAQSKLCLPVTEGSAAFDLCRIMQLAANHGSIPVFYSTFPTAVNVHIVCDCIFQIPPMDRSQSFKETLSKLLVKLTMSTAHESLIVFKNEIASLNNSDEKNSINVRMYILRFILAQRDTVYPALIFS